MPIGVELQREPAASPPALDLRAVGLILVVIATWNAAFAVEARFGIFTVMTVAASVGLARSAAVRVGWGPLFALDRRVITASLAATAILVGATALLRGPLMRAWPWLDLNVRDLYAMFGEASTMQGYVLLPFIAGAEELIFRGAIQRGLEGKLGRWLAALVGTGIYVLGHALSGRPLLIALAAILGLFWALLRAMTRSLWPGLVSHIVWDMFLVVWAPVTSTVLDAHPVLHL